MCEAEPPITFAIGTAVTHFNGQWRVSWAANPDGEDENSGTEFVRESVSADGGDTWSAPHVLAPPLEDGTHYHSHGSYHQHDGTLYFLAKRGPHRGGPTKAFLLSDDGRTWVDKGVVTIDQATFWPMDTPQPMANGDWIMGGCSGKDGKKAAVAIAEGGNPLAWQVQELPGQSLGYGETTVIVIDETILAISREHSLNNRGAMCRVSKDGGVTWSQPKPSDIPIARAKPYAGRLKDGRPYLVCNLWGRGQAYLLLGQPDALTFDRVWQLRPGKPSQPRFTGRTHRKQWAYPYAHEHDKELFIVHHNAKEDVELIIVMLAALR